VAGIACVSCVVSTCSHSGGVEQDVNVVPLGVLVNPLSDSVEHVAVDFDVLISDCRVVKRTEDVIHDFVNGDPWVLPCVDDTRDNILQDCSCNSSST